MKKQLLKYILLLPFTVLVSTTVTVYAESSEENIIQLETVVESKMETEEVDILANPPQPNVEEAEKK